MTDSDLAIGVMVDAGFPGGRLAHGFKSPMGTGCMYIVAGILSPRLVPARLESFTWGCK